MKSKANKQIFVDMTLVKEKDGHKSLYPNTWMMVDQYSETKIVQCFKTKDAMVEPTCQLFFNWKLEGRLVLHLQMDNAGENRQLVERLNSKDWKLHPSIEYTAHDTPQHNYLAEVAIATIAKHARAMMINANILEHYRYLIQHKAMETAAKLDGLICKQIDGVMKH